MDKKLDEIKEVERQFHNEMYGSVDQLGPVDVDTIKLRQLNPCYTTGSNKYSDNLLEFHKILNNVWKDKYVLDYACGYGRWACYFALTGAKKSAGFDISDEAIRIGSETVKNQGLNDKVQLSVMDASKLHYDDNTFDVVIGTGVLHHVIKYENVFEELYRVMKPGSKAYFAEGLADFFMHKIWWKMKGDVDQGDVPMFSKEIYRLTDKFSKVEIIGDNFVYSLKAILWKRGMGKIRKIILKSAKNIDDVLFSITPKFRKLGSYCYIILQK